jgi:hypothetical protein
MKQLLLIFFTIFSPIVYSQNPIDSVTINQNFEKVQKLRKQSALCFAFSTIPITIGGIQFMNGNLVNGLFFMTVGVVAQITGIVIDMEAHPRKEKREKIVHD